MPRIIFIEHDGAEHPVDAESGLSIMENAVRHAVPGIDADCGGACACATCHVYIASEWRLRLGEPEAMESSMLEFAEHVEAGSRLSCQISVTEEMEGLCLRIPESQR